MRIPGVVDVYQVGDQWVARSWPKVQNQPNSAAQLLWRKKFKDAHAIAKDFPPRYKRSWEAIESPSGKMWLDIALHCLLVAPTHFSQIPQGDQMKMELYYAPNKPDDWMTNWCVWINYAGLLYMSTGPGYSCHYGSTFKDVLKWNDLGWICPNGKRPKKKWQLRWTENYAPLIGADFPYIGEWPNGESTMRNWFLPCPNGISWSKLLSWSAGPGYEADYALQMPPLHFPVKPWPGSFTP